MGIDSLQPTTEKSEKKKSSSSKKRKHRDDEAEADEQANGLTNGVDEGKGKVKKDKKEKKDKKDKKEKKENGMEIDEELVKDSNDVDNAIDVEGENENEEEAKAKRKREKKERKESRREKKKQKLEVEVDQVENGNKDKKNKDEEKKDNDNSTPTIPLPLLPSLTSFTPSSLPPSHLSPLLLSSLLSSTIVTARPKEKEKMEFKPTEIQSRTMPVLLSGRDLVGVGKTGSGKTLAFALPAIQHILSLIKQQQQKGSHSSAKSSKRNGFVDGDDNGGTIPHVAVVVLSPTRELALQTQATFSALLEAPFSSSSSSSDGTGMSSSLSKRIGSACIYGGVSKWDQEKLFTNPNSNSNSKRKGKARGGGSSSPPINIVVGTPGRVLDLSTGEGSVLDLSKTSYLVLDEGDRLLDKGFERDLGLILSECLPPPRSSNSSTSKSSSSLGPWISTGLSIDSSYPPKYRQTSMLSATFPPSVQKLAQEYMSSSPNPIPELITVGSIDLAANEAVELKVEVLSDGRKKEWRLRQALEEFGFRPPSDGGWDGKKNNNKGNGKGGGGGGSDEKGVGRDKALIFALYKKEASRLHQFLWNAGYEVGCINGDMTQDKRTAALESFKAGETNLLVATDVAARGLDIPKVECVLNVTFPLTIEDYIHRVGRTGRAGRLGKSLTFFTDDDKKHAGSLVKVIRDAGQEPNPDLMKFDQAIKKKVDPTFGHHYKELDWSQKPKKVVFD